MSDITDVRRIVTECVKDVGGVPRVRLNQSLSDAGLVTPPAVNLLFRLISDRMLAGLGVEVDPPDAGELSPEMSVESLASLVHANSLGNQFEGTIRGRTKEQGADDSFAADAAADLGGDDDTSSW